MGEYAERSGSFFLCNYLIVLPTSLVLFWLKLLPWSVAGWFLVLLVLEHLCQESSRLLLALSEPVLASWVGFLRGGLWCLAIAAFLWLDPSLRTLQVVMCAWVIGDVIALFLALKRIRRRVPGPITQPINWAWIGKGLRVSLPLLLGTLALRGLFTFDRYFIEWTQGSEVLAAYVFYSGVASGVVSMIDAGLIAFAFSGMLAAAAEDSPHFFIKSVSRLALRVIVMVLVQAGILIIAFDPLLNYINNPVFTRYAYLMPWVMLSSFIYVLMLVPNLALYAKHCDKTITITSFVGLGVFLGVFFFFGQSWGPQGVPIALACAFFCMLIIKVFYYFDLRKRLLLQYVTPEVNSL